MSFSLIKPVYAQCNSGDPNINLQDCLKLNETQSVGDVYSRPTDIINPIVNNLFVVAGVVLFVMILYAGFKFIEDTTKGKDEARDIAKAAAIGMIVMLAAYWLVRIIEVMTGQELIF